MNARQILTRKNRRTGTMVSLYDGEKAFMDVNGGRWQTVCEDHGAICSHDTRKLAETFLSVPDEWREECRLEKDGHVARCQRCEELFEYDGSGWSAPAEIIDANEEHLIVHAEGCYHPEFGDKLA